MFASHRRPIVSSSKKIKQAACAAATRRWQRSVIPEALEDRRLMSVVAVFNNNTYVDNSSGGHSAESVNIQKTLQSQSNTVKTFTGIDSNSIRKAAGGAETLLIPELENGNLSGAMKSAAKSALSAYVNEGGGLIICADEGGNHNTLLNSVFGFSLTSGSEDVSTRTSAASGTAFSSAPTGIDDNDATTSETTASLPSGASAIYKTPAGDSTVTLIKFGSGNIVILGWDFYNASPIGSQDGGWLTVLSKAVAQTKVANTDPDDTIGEAKAAVVGGTYTDTISVGSDVDMRKLVLTAGQVITFSMTKNAGSNVDAFLRLFNDNGDQVGGDDQSGGGNNAVFTKTINFSGNYYIACSGWPNTGFDPYTGFGDNASGTTGAYTLKISLPNTDPDDQISEASPIMVGGTVNFTIGNGLSGGQPLGQDVDMLKFTATAGQSIGFDVDRRNSSTLDSYLRIFSYNSGTNTATELKNNDNAAAPGETLGKESYLEYTFASAGTYYVGVSGAPNKSYSAVTGSGDVSGSTGDYSLTLKAIPADPDDQISEAGLVTIPKTITGKSISSATDVNMIKFTVTAGKTVAFDIDRPAGSSLDSYLRLFNSSGTQLAANDNGVAPGEAATGKDAYLSFKFTSAGTYYIAVSSKGNSAYSPITGLGDAGGSTTGAYTLTLS